MNGSTEMERRTASDLAGRLPTTDEIDSAAHAATAIAVAMELEDGLCISGIDGPTRIAPAVGAMIIDLLQHVAGGSMVTIVPTGAYLTTTEAAALLNVSRPHLTKLLKDGEIAHVMVGSHRKIALDDLLEYREMRRSRQKDGLKTLADLGQAYDAG